MRRIGNMGMEHFLEGSTYIYTQDKVDNDPRRGYFTGRKLSERGLYRAFIPFNSDSSKYKIRPVLLLEDSSITDIHVNVLMFTTAIVGTEGGYKFNQIPDLKYPILNWKSNGFDTPSYVVFSYDEDTMNYYSEIDKSLILEPISARGNHTYSEFLMNTNQYNEILKALKLKRNGDILSKVNPKADPKSKYFDWKTMQIPEFAWKAYRKEFLDKDKEEKEVKALQKEEKLKQDFKNLRLYYLYDKDSKSVGDMTYSEKIFKDNRPRKCKKTKDWATYESYMGKYFSVIDNIQDEINPKYKDMLPTRKEVMELKEHIFSDEELRIFLEESL